MNPTKQEKKIPLKAINFLWKEKMKEAMWTIRITE